MVWKDQTELESFGGQSEELWSLGPRFREPGNKTFKAMGTASRIVNSANNPKS